MAVYQGVVTISHPSLGGTGTNTWHLRTTNTTSDSDEAGILMDELHTFYNGTNDVTAGGTVTSFDGLLVRIDDGSKSVLAIDPWSSTNGTSQPPLPPSQCLVVGWRTSVASKRARGRTFIGPCALNTLQDNGTPLETKRTALEGHAAAFIDSWDGVGGGAFGVWSDMDHVLRDFIRGSVANQFASLRSRRD